MTSKTIKRMVFPVVIAAALTTAGFTQDAKQDMKDAGHSVAHATKKTGHKIKNGTKKAAHKTARATRRGADKVEDKTK